MCALVDNNLPLTMTRKIRELDKSLDIKHISELGLGNASDDFLRNRFSSEHIIWISRDEDFWLKCPQNWSVIWVSLHNPRLAFLRDTIAPLLARNIPLMKPGQRLLVSEDTILLT